jgi:hypothetical protein
MAPVRQPPPRRACAYAAVALIAAALAAGAPACGDGLVEEGYRGEPVATFTGHFTDEQARGAFRGVPQLRAALFWSPNGTASDADLEGLVEQTSTSMPAEIPGDFLLNVFEPPGDEHLSRGADGGSTGYGVARLLVYLDEDEDGLRSADEGFWGHLQNEAVVYAERALPAGDAPTRPALDAGFHVVSLPLPCDIPVPDAAGDGFCGVPIGSTCEKDGDCDGGICLDDKQVGWPGGYCAVPEPPTGGCRPAGAAFLPMPMPPNVNGVYVAACSAGANCSREGYRCDAGTGGCRPDTPMRVLIAETLNPIPFCAGATAPRQSPTSGAGGPAKAQP